MSAIVTQNKLMGFHAGRNLRKVYAYFKAKKQIGFDEKGDPVIVKNQEQMGELIGKYQTSISRYFGYERFSSHVLQQLEPLRKWGINPEYFEKENAPMLLKDVKTEEELKQEIKLLREELEKLRKGKEERNN